MRFKCLPAFILLALLASCGPQSFDFAQGRPAPVTTAISTPIAAASAPITAVPHAQEIRFALIGSVTNANVWALFDAKGYSYNNYAVRSGYWPRLYQLSIPDRQFEPMAASGAPSPIQQEGSFYTAVVPLRADLKWTDGSLFTADDVAFTVNTVLSFQLGFDWRDYYNSDYLDHAEAVDAHTVKFYFKKQPNVGVWQYGALQGPVVQRAFWSSKVAASAALLPPADLALQIEALKAKADDLQKQYDALLATPIPPNQIQQMQLNLNRRLSDLNQANADLAKAQSNYDTAMNAARDSLYALEDKNEPTLGDWIPAGEENGEWVNKANPDHPFNAPKFDNAIYKTYSSEEDAVRALQSGQVDGVLNQNGISAKIVPDLQKDNSFQIVFNADRSVRFLVINQTRQPLADPALRRAMDCVLDRATIAQAIMAVPLESFVQPGAGIWYNSQALGACAGQAGSSQLEQAVAILKSAGYTWKQEPPDRSAGQGLALPNGNAFPAIGLMVSSSDSSEMSAASYVEQRAHLLGLPLTVTPAAPDQINYAVFSSRQFDVAILGWRVSESPGYLCDWFEAGNPFGYQSDRLRSACEALNSTGDLSAAQKDVYEIQSILAQDLPFIPLYSGITYDAYRNIFYPFDQVLGGLSGIYGAPSLAIPAPQ
jgi:peptide/nickel transport system substrate-binding protein